MRRMRAVRTLKMNPEQAEVYLGGVLEILG